MSEFLRQSLMNFLSFRVFRLLSSSLLLYSQHFGWCVLWLSSGVFCRTPDVPPSRTYGIMIIGIGSLSIWVTIIWSLQVQSWLLESNNTEILHTHTKKGWRTHQPKHCEYTKKDENNSTKTLNDKNQVMMSILCLDKTKPNCEKILKYETYVDTIWTAVFDETQASAAPSTFIRLCFMQFFLVS